MAEDPPEERRRLVRAPTGGSATGRGLGQRVKTAPDRSMSSQEWLRRQLNDPYVQQAKAEGWRSRAAFKLSEIDDKYRLIKHGSRVIDLGCAPGGWVQVALKRGAAAVAGVDLLHVAPIPGAELMEADFTDPAVGPELLARLGGPPDIVLSDMAPNTSGHHQTDHIRIVSLVEEAAEFAIENLKPGGVFLSKAFQGGMTGDVLQRLRGAFTTVRQMKPKASRAESSEVYLIAQGLLR